MKTTFEIPDELFRQAKSRAALDGRTLRDLMIEGLEYAVARPAAGHPLHTVKFPIIKSTRKGRKITDEMVNKAVEQMHEEEAQCYAKFMRR
jgi:hypothetical protein